MAKQQAASSAAPKVARLQAIYRDKISPEMVEKFGRVHCVQFTRSSWKGVTLPLGASGHKPRAPDWEKAAYSAEWSKVARDREAPG